MGMPFLRMQLSGVRDIGSNVLKNTSETSLWEDLSCNRPVGQRLHVKNSCGSANQTSSPPVMSKSNKGSKSPEGTNRNGYWATKHKVSCKRGDREKCSTAISYITSYTTSHTISQINILYDVIHIRCRIRYSIWCHVNILYHVVYDVKYDISNNVEYDIVYVYRLRCYNRKIKKKIMPAGVMCREEGEKP